MKWALLLVLVVPAGVLAEESEIFQKPSFGANYFYSPLEASGGSTFKERSIDLDLFLPVSPSFAWVFKYSRRAQEWGAPAAATTKYEGNGYNAGFRIFWD